MSCKFLMENRLQRRQYVCIGKKNTFMTIISPKTNKNYVLLRNLQIQTSFNITSKQCTIVLPGLVIIFMNNQICMKKDITVCCWMSIILLNHALNA